MTRPASTTDRKSAKSGRTSAKGPTPDHDGAEPAFIEVLGARVHNLKNIDVRIPRDKLVVITGLSGSGKSSLAFDTLHAEGQRRYIETFNAYARQFLGGIERPDVDLINGLSPVIAIEQKTIGRNPRSTVGTITEVYDLLRLLFARASTAYSYVSGEPMVRYSDAGIVDLIVRHYADREIVLLAPIVRGRKGHYRELFEQLIRQGFLRIRLDGKLVELTSRPRPDRYKLHDIEVVIDRLKVGANARKRLSDSCGLALKYGKGDLMVLDPTEERPRYFSRNLMCPTSGIAYEEPEPNLFSFNSPYGACPRCSGLGQVTEVDVRKIVPDRNKSIKRGGIIPLGSYKNNWIFRQVEAVLENFGHDLETPIIEMGDEVLAALLNGMDEPLRVSSRIGLSDRKVQFEGIIPYILEQAEEGSKQLQNWADRFTHMIGCPECQGSRLKRTALWFRFAGKNIHELAVMPLEEFDAFMREAPGQLDQRQALIAQEVIKEITARTRFLLDVGLEYLTLDRSARTLSGGEAQRIRLATQIGSELTGVLYILDEPSIGLHQRDDHRLIASLRRLRDGGNSVIVVEHDKEMMMQADHIIDLGPGAGEHGGRLVAEGNAIALQGSDSLTGRFLKGDLQVRIPEARRKGNGHQLVLRGAKGNNLKDVDVSFPLGTFICVTGVSGSGKSSLISDTLYPILSRHFHRAETHPLPYSTTEGLEHLDKVIEVDQSPIGRTPRSNPATYTGLFDHIRQLYAQLPSAKVRGYKAGRFSFNTPGGRCETCKGAGVRTIEMNFLPDVTVPCQTCRGKRYDRETLEVRFKGRSVADVLAMPVEEATELFKDVPQLMQKLRTLLDVGLGYVKLGQSSTTLSGGEAQRIKLATELSRRGTGNTFYILDEPTTGLHFEDVRQLIGVLDRLVEQGNTVLVIEHDLDIVKVADHVIDLGPEGGIGGGRIVARGTPEEIVRMGKGYTARYLENELA
ncbi:MAG: excinuclease ABC subunit UvrA [Flavobacteriales bacterium]|nr:excinuclease ABC subunit UvrA [Flavobacteriales bacterium]MCB9166473.1 excinuclease ABC subunit UvrA [Flavobacteriales bacterium]